MHFPILVVGEDLHILYLQWSSHHSTFPILPYISGPLCWTSTSEDRVMPEEDPITPITPEFSEFGIGASFGTGCRPSIEMTHRILTAFSWLMLFTSLA